MKESEPRGSGGSEDAQRVRRHDRLHSRLARRCSKRPQEPRKASGKTANDPFTLPTQDRSAWNVGRDHQASGITVSGTTAAEGANDLPRIGDLSVVAFLSNRPQCSLNEVAQAITHTGRLNQLSHRILDMCSRKSRTAVARPSNLYIHQSSPDSQILTEHVTICHECCLHTSNFVVTDRKPDDSACGHGCVLCVRRRTG